MSAANVVRRPYVFLSLAFALAIPALAAAASAPRVVASSAFNKSASAVPAGGRLRIENVQVDDSRQALAFDLQRFEVFAPDAEITIHGKGGRTTVEPAPKHVYFRGTVDGEPDSKVFLAALADGRTQGIVNRGSYVYLIGADDSPAKAAGSPLTARWVDPAALETKKGGGGFACGEDKLPLTPGSLQSLALGGDSSLSDLPRKAETAALPGFTAKVAIETDYEFFQLFNNTTTETTYIGNLIGYSSTIYVNEINTSMVVQSVSLWTGGAGSDPWTQTSTFCGLMELGKYWNVNHTGVARTITHMMSGKGLGGGIAWVGVLCSGAFNTGAAASCPGLGAESTPWGGGYGFTASLSGTFNINSPTVMWDIVAVSHEIGHNFNSPHTHCYNGVGGNASSIDNCRSGETDGNSHACYSGAQTLPGPSGAGSGTIMSYCHLLSGGFSNISLNFGTGHPFGVEPGREATRMSAHVVSVASGNPSCLAFTSGGTSPTVTAVARTSGSTAGGNTVTITGTGFVSGATVTFGTTAGTGVNVVNATTITVTAPAHATGAVRVTVTNSDSLAGFKDNAYFYSPPPAAAGFYTVTLCRIVDTRNANGPLGGPSLAANATRLFTIPGTCGIPSSAKAISANITVVPLTTNTGSFNFYPGNAFPLGNSNLSFSNGKVRAASSILQLSTDSTGTIGVQNASNGANQLLIDVNGYFQ